MQNKQYTMQFFSLPNNQLRSQSPSSDHGTPDNPDLYTEHDVYGMEYFHWPAWASCLAVLPPSSCTPAC